ncbi:hypothetical protein ACVWZB_004826 [Paenibacillus polymyxa]
MDTNEETKKEMQELYTFYTNVLSKIPYYATFLQDGEVDGNIMFQKGKSYKVTKSNKTHYFVQVNQHSNEVAAVPKSLEEILFVL